MKVLLDTNIIIHRETDRVINQDIGILFKWLDRLKYTKCIHPLTRQEIGKHKDPVVVHSFSRKMDSYELLMTTSPVSLAIQEISKKYDVTENDFLNTALINELFNERVDLLVSEDKKIMTKARELGISERVFTINSFLENITSEYPDLVNYNVLSVRQALFGTVNLNDPFFQSFKEDYPGFEKWFNKKAEEKAYITVNKENNLILSFLYLKRENKDEVYADITPVFKPKKRLKIGTFKVVGNGFRLGERFLKIIFDNALSNKVEEIYVTIFDIRDEQKRLIVLLEEWGFGLWGKKENELVYVKNFSKRFNIKDPKSTYPYISLTTDIFLVPIYPDYHTELFPDSILRTESPLDFTDNEPHRNAISKIYISRSIERNIKRGDILIFYRTGGFYKSIISTICIVEDVIFNFIDEDEFVRICKKRSVYSEQNLRQQWRMKPNNRPFAVSMLYVYSFPKRSTLSALIENKVILNKDDAPRGFRRITLSQFKTILKLTQTDESFIID